MSHEAGKGDAMRPTNHEAFSAGMDRIFGGAAEPESNPYDDQRRSMEQAFSEPEHELEQCTWKLTDWEALIWESSCGEAWSFIDGGPEENRVRFCQGCGKPVTVVSTDEEPEDDICSGCSGSGEGMYDGSTCYKCKGRGVEPVEQDDEP